MVNHWNVRIATFGLYAITVVLLAARIYCLAHSYSWPGDLQTALAGSTTACIGLTLYLVHQKP